MRITCPNCSASYDVPDRVLGAEARPVRCARCGTVWTPRAAEGAADEPAPAVAADPPRPAVTRAPAPSAVTAPMEAGEVAPLRAPRPRAPQVIHPPLPTITDAPALERGSRLSLWAAWTLSVVAVAGLVIALWLFRTEVTEAWPPAARLYSALGG